ncbi:hypothetical protein PMIN06_007851 [Paraphaeosphaeria minitans]
MHFMRCLEWSRVHDGQTWAQMMVSSKFRLAIAVLLVLSGRVENCTFRLCDAPLIGCFSQRMQPMTMREMVKGNALAPVAFSTDCTLQQIAESTGLAAERRARVEVDIAVLEVRLRRS